MTYQEIPSSAKGKCLRMTLNYTPRQKIIMLVSNLINQKYMTGLKRLPLNSQKCKELRHGICKDSAEANILSSHDNKEINISRVEEMKDHGVAMDSKLKFDKHIAEISRKAAGVLASIKRTMTYIDRNVFIGLYKSLVIPLLESSVSVWNP